MELKRFLNNRQHRAGVVRDVRDQAWRRAQELEAKVLPQPELGEPPAIRRRDEADSTTVERYWGEHTVAVQEYVSRRHSERQLEWRFDQYPLFREFSGHWGDHRGESVLDYGCGPGNDLTGFALYSGAERLVGLDVSPKALSLSAGRLALHGIDPARVELIQISDSSPEVPVDDASIDHVNSQGVIMMTTDPQAILGELARVTRPGGSGCVMIYNRDSVWYHLYTAYQKMIVEDAFPGLDIDAAFTRNTDGEECPISRAWTAETFSEMCAKAGFEAEYVGGYPSLIELDCLKYHWAPAIADERLPEEHREFLRRLTYDRHGYPMLGPVHAGIGGVYRLRKPAGAAASTRR